MSRLACGPGLEGAEERMPARGGVSWAVGVGHAGRGAGPRRWLGRCSREEEEEKADWAEERGCAGN